MRCRSARSRRSSADSQGRPRCEQPLRLVPVASINSSHDAFTRSYACSVELDIRRFGWRWGRREFAPTEKAPRLWAFLLESGVQGVEFGHRGVHVFEVEPDLQRDPTLLVNAVYLEEFVVAAPQGSRRQCPTSLEREPGARLARR